MPDGEGEDVLLPRKRKPPDKHQITQITMTGAAHEATASAKAAADVGAATADHSSYTTFENVHIAHVIALKRTKYAVAAAANKVAAAGWNMRIGTVACMPMDNNLNTIDAAVAAANIVAFVRRTNDDRKR